MTILLFDYENMVPDDKEIARVPRNTEEDSCLHHVPTSHLFFYYILFVFYMSALHKCA